MGLLHTICKRITVVETLFSINLLLELGDHTSPIFSLAAPMHSFMLWPYCPQISQGRGWFGLNSSRRMVKLGSWVDRPEVDTNKGSNGGRR